MKHIFNKTVTLVFALILCVLLASCGTADTGNGSADAEITALSIGYLTENAYNNGNYSEESITANADFTSNSLLYMVVDMNIKALADNGGDLFVDVAVHASDAFVLTLTLQEVPTGKIESVDNNGGSLSYHLSYSVPAKKNEIKNAKMILKLIPNVGGNADVTISVSGGNGDTVVSGKTNASASLSLFVTNLKFTLKNDGTYRVSSTGTPTFNEIEIPGLYNGKPVTEIEAEGFAGCENLTGIIIPESVTEIGDSAFSGCINLRNVEIPQSITQIGNSWFKDCTGLTSITIPESVTSIGRRAFYGCSNLRRIALSDNVTSIGSWAFYNCSSLTGITIPDGVTIIGNSAFSDCIGLTNITIPTSTKSIGSAAFYNCKSLESITLPFIGNTASGTDHTYFGYIFGADLSAASDEYVPQSLKTVFITGDTRIGWAAFCNCNSLSKIVIQGNVTSIDDYAFNNCRSLTEISVNDANAYFCSENGILFNKTKTELICYPSKKTETAYSIPESVTSINRAAFDGCSILTSIDIPDGVKFISLEAFYGCSGLTDIVIPKGVTNIDYQTFQNCSNLTHITIPDSITSIGLYAFSGCINLTAITFDGTVAQWQAISFDSTWNTNTGAYTVICTDGTLSK